MQMLCCKNYCKIGLGIIEFFRECRYNLLYPLRNKIPMVQKKLGKGLRETCVKWEGLMPFCQLTGLGIANQRDRITCQKRGKSGQRGNGRLPELQHQFRMAQRVPVLSP